MYTIPGGVAGEVFVGGLDLAAGLLPPFFSLRQSHGATGFGPAHKPLRAALAFGHHLEVNPSLADGDVAQHSLVLVLLLPVYLHELAEHLLRQRLLGFIAEGLAALRCVDGEQPNLELLVACSEYRDGVAIRDAHDFARERRRLGGEGG